MRQAAGFSSVELTQLFELAISALWQRSYMTLGETTLTAIVDRVLYNATEKFPVFASLKLEANRLEYAEFIQRASSTSERELAKAIEFILVELLTVIGNLTAE